MTSGSFTSRRVKSTTTVLPLPGSAASLTVAVWAVSQLPVAPEVKERGLLVTERPLAAAGMVTATSLFHFLLRVAVMVEEVGGLALLQAAAPVPLGDSQRVVGLAVRLTVGRWSAATRAPYLRAGYWLALPKSQGSSELLSPTMSMSQLA